MKITEHAHLVLPMIQKLAEKESLFYAEHNINQNRKFDLDGNNQCIIFKNSSWDIYIVAFEELHILEDFLHLSSETIMKITKVRKFLTDLYGDSSNVGNRLKIKINHGKGIEFTLIGSNLMRLEIEVTDDFVTVSTRMTASADKCSISLKDYQNIDLALTSALDIFTNTTLAAVGFKDGTLDSDEVKKFLKKSIEDLVSEHLSDLDVNVFELNKLLSTVCLDMNIDPNEIFDYAPNKKHTSTKSIDENSLEIPSNLIKVLPKVFYKVTPINGSKMEQLINLISFYYYITQKDFKVSFGAKRLYKHNFINPSKLDFNNNYYTLNFSDFIRISVGHNQQSDIAFDPIYSGPTKSNTFKFVFWFEKSLTSVGNRAKMTEYLTNNVDFIYDKVLDSLVNFINTQVDNIGNPITEKHLELFKMATI